MNKNTLELKKITENKTSENKKLHANRRGTDPAVKFYKSRKGSILSNHSVFFSDHHNNLRSLAKAHGTNGGRRRRSVQFYSSSSEDDAKVLPEPSMSMRKFHDTLQEYTSL